jgi:polysaccharide biosynthesis transport protein
VEYPLNETIIPKAFSHDYQSTLLYSIRSIVLSLEEVLKNMNSEAQSTLKLDGAWPIIKRRWLPASLTFFGIFALFYTLSLKEKPVYIAEGEILIKKASSMPSVTGVGTEVGLLDPLTKENSPLDTEAEIISSVPLIEQTVQKLQLKNIEGSLLKYPEVLKNLKLSKVQASDLLTITYQDQDPEKAATLVNTLIEVYLNDDILRKRAELTATREFIEEKLPESEDFLSQAETDLRLFKEQNNFFALQSEAASTTELMADLQQKMTDTQSQIANAYSRSQALQNQLGMNPKQAGTLTSVSQSPAVQEARQTLQEAESQLAVERTRLTGNHPTIIDLESKVASLKGLLQGRVGDVAGSSLPMGDLQLGELQQELTKELVGLEANRQGLSSQMATLASLQSGYQERLSILPQLEQELRRLERQLELSQTMYSQLQQKLQEVRIAESQSLGNASLVSPALVPEKPISRKSLYQSMGIFLGAVVGVATALLLESQDRSIKSVDEAKAQLQFSLLGVIPTVGKSIKLFSNRRSTPQLIVRDNPRSPISEAYRMLQTKLKFACAEQDVKVIVVTSAIAKEGKSTVSSNLAAAISQVGRRVLLVDADLRRPLQHEIWNLSNEVGLGNTIGGQINLELAVQPTMPNLDVLTAGTLSPNPIALLDSQRMTSLMEEFADRYDFVIIDAPPLNVAADASILGKMADGILWVVRPGVLDSTNMAVAQEIVDQSRQTVLGVVVNGVIGENEYNSYDLNDRSIAMSR